MGCYLAERSHQRVTWFCHGAIYYQQMAKTANIKAILFDKDGTLIDIEKTWLPAFRNTAAELARRADAPALAGQALRHVGYDTARDLLSADALLASVGNGELIERWLDLAGLGEAEFEPLLAYLEAEAVAHNTALFEIPPLFEQLRQLDLALGLATMDAEWIARHTARNFAFEHLLSFVCGYDSGHGAKPAPDMLLAFARSLALKPAEIAMVGDTAHDLEMGLNAGAGLVVGVLSGANRSADLSRADVILPDARHLPALFS